MKIYVKKVDSRQLDESDYRSKNGDNVLRLWNSTLQILLPVAALAVIWGRRGLFTRFLLQFDKSCISELCPSFKEKQGLLDWINHYVTSKWFFHKNSTVNTSIEFWKDGSLLCSLINTAIPGACSNPNRHWQHPPSHGQALAYKYLGVAPVFTESELMTKQLTEQQAVTLENYINNLQRAVTKASLHDFKFSSTYIAKGMGLVSGEQFRKMCFYIYLNAPSSLNNGDIVINIRAPFDNYHTLSIPSYLIKRKTTEKPVTARKNQSKLQKYLSRSPSIELKNFINNDLKKDESNKIPITFSIESDRIKVIYIPQHSGIFEISIITDGFHLLGSPFPVSISENTSNIIDNLNETDIKSNSKKIITKKVVSETIDFADDKARKERSVLAPNTLAHTTITEEEDEFSDSAGNSDNESSNDGENSNSLISPICFVPIDPEVSNDKKPFLVLKENRSKGGCDTDSIAQESANTFVTAVGPVDPFETIYNNEFRLSNNSPEVISRYDAVKDNSCSLSILNYLSHFKLEDRTEQSNNNQIVAYYKDFWQSKLLSQSSHSLNSYDVQSCSNFKEKLTFWKSQSEYNLNNKILVLKQRRSLPNLHTVHLLNQEFCRSTNAAESMWKQNHLSRKHIVNMANYSRYSLPNISVSLQKQNFTETEVDEYMVGLEFRDKFKKRLQYWESLASYSCSSDNSSLQLEYVDDTDSGFGYSIANSDLLYPNDYMCSILEDSSSNLSFAERQNYWERLSSLSLNEDDREIETTAVVKRNDNELVKIKQQLLQSAKEDDRSEQNNEDDTQDNFTDDFKNLQNYRERMKKKFSKNKKFFQSLESSIR